jgi:hypothetical protein
VPESAVKAAERKRLARRAADRRSAVRLLQITECTARYAASQAANGASPEEVRQTLLFTAGELVAVAEALRRAVRLSGPERRALALQMARFGTPTKVIADRLGVSGRSVRNYVLAGKRCPLPQAGERISRYCRVLRAAPDGAPNTHPGPWPL